MRTGFLSNMVGNSKEAEPEDIKVQFQVVDASAVRQRRTVFFVRHAESAWNNAQSKNKCLRRLITHCLRQVEIRRRS